ncbi:MAG: Gfo/Idh/MocA family oxidoreductase [Actinomycetota bacterium]
MIEVFKEVSEFCKLEIPVAHRVPVAIIGAGGIVDGAHLPAYTKTGIEVVGIFDTDGDKARDVASRHHIPKVFSSVQDLIDNSGATIVDIAVPSTAQPEIFAQVANAGKHILAQKPMAPTIGEGLAMADLVDAKGIVAGVNQQLRFEEGVAAAHKMVELGWIGTVTSMSITVNLATPWELWPWARDLDRLEVMLHSIHYHDLIRWFLGEPKTVFCAAGRTKGQYPKGETRTVTTSIYGDGVTSLVHANHVNRGGDNLAEFRIDGDQGSIRGTLGLLYDYPNGRVDTLEINSLVIPTDGWLPYPVTTRWFPDAFIGTMGSVMSAIATGSPVRSSVRDNVNTLRLVDALYRSMDSGKSVDL